MLTSFVNRQFDETVDLAIFTYFV